MHVSRGTSHNSVSPRRSSSALRASNHAACGTDLTGVRGSVACEVFHVEHSVSSTAWVQHRAHRHPPPLLAAGCSRARPERWTDSNCVPMVAAGTDRRSMQPCASQDGCPRTVRASPPDVSRGTPRADLGLHLCTPVMRALIATSTWRTANLTSRDPQQQHAHDMHTCRFDTISEAGHSTQSSRLSERRTADGTLRAALTRGCARRACST